jgi:hypothetical protein
MFRVEPSVRSRNAPDCGYSFLSVLAPSPLGLFQQNPPFSVLRVRPVEVRSTGEADIRAASQDRRLRALLGHPLGAPDFLKADKAHPALADRGGRKADTLAHRQFGSPLTGGYPAAARGPMAMPSLARRRSMRASSPLFQRREDGQCGERRRPSDPGDGARLPPHHRPWQQPRSRKRRGQPAGASATKGSDANRV